MGREIRVALGRPRAGGAPRRAGILAAAVAGLALAAPAASAQERACGAGGAQGHSRGEWPTYGHDLTNSRSQPAEQSIGPENVTSLEAAWVHKAGGAVNSTPIVAGGCLFIGSSDGTVHALHADSGEAIWSTELPIKKSAFGGGIVGAPAVTGDSVLVAINEEGSPYLVSLDRATGEERWRTTIDSQSKSGVNASVVVHKGLAFVGFFGNAAPGTEERGGFALIDARTGQLVKRTFTINDASFAEGYAGAGIWSTPAIDTEADLAYVGTSNPHDPQREHELTNSLVKIDLRRNSATFGEILDSYKGRPDSYVEGGADQPACETAPDVYYVPPFSATCVQLDLDFGASPNLYVDAAGNQRLGDLEKSGDYHAIDPKGMVGVWRQTVGVPCFACNAASPAAANGTIFTAAGPPGQLYALDGASGEIRGAGPLTGPSTYNAVSTANGLVYAVDSAGFLNVFQADNSMLQVEKRELAADTGAPMTSAATSSGVAIARGTVFVAATSYVIALRSEAPVADPPMDAAVKAPRLASDQSTSRRFSIRVAAAEGADQVRHFEVEVRREGRKGRRYRRISSDAQAGKLRFTGVRGASYRFRARAVGPGDRVSAWRYARTIVPYDTARRSRATRFSSGWRRVRMRSAFGGGVRVSTRAGATMRMKVRGGPIYIVGRKSRRGGRARLTIGRRSRMVSFYARKPRKRVVVAVVRAGRGTRRVKLVNIGTGRHGRQVAVDAVAVRRRG